MKKALELLFFCSKVGDESLNVCANDAKEGGGWSFT